MHGELSFQQINELDGGMCEELTNISTYAMRAVGIPVIRDFTPAWAKRAHFGHHWLALVLPNDTTLAFDGTYRHPERGQNQPSRIAAKVYRFDFEADPGKLRRLVNDPQSLPDLEFVRSPNIRDVTDQYYTTVDITLALPVGSTAEHFALGVFNYGRWQAVAYGDVKGGKKIDFKKLNHDIVYILMHDQAGQWETIGDPFLLDAQGELNYFTTQDHQPLCLDQWFAWDEQIIEDQDTFKLEYWQDNRWQMIADGLRPENSRICVDTAPVDALLRITIYRGRPYYMRPFIINGEERQVFY